MSTTLPYYIISEMRKVPMTRDKVFLGVTDRGIALLCKYTSIVSDSRVLYM